MKIILSFDVEGDFHKYLHSPYIWHKLEKLPNGNQYTYSKSKINAFRNYFKWRLNNLVKPYASGSQGLKRVIEFLENEDIPASFAICGYLYMKNKQKIDLSMPWSILRLKKNHYFWKDKYPENFDFSKIILAHNKNKNFDFGLHGFVHEAFPLETSETMDKILKLSRSSAKELGINLKTFVPPFNMAFNNNLKEVITLLRKNNFSCLRFIGEDNFFSTFKHEPASKEIQKIGGVNMVYLSASLEGNFNEKKVLKVISKIKEAYNSDKNNKNKVFCIMSHDYTFENTRVLELFAEEIKKLQKDYNLEFTNLAKL
ncbi:MAG: hypothetical protein WC796_01100 [Candidatus Pacearchaeota archaeon]|jgi:hypothetical protein